MHYQTRYLHPDLKLSSFADTLFRADVVFDYHLLVWFLAGETRLVQGTTAHVFGPGDTFLLPRHQPASIVNYPRDGQPHQAVSMHLTHERLRAFYGGRPLPAQPTQLPGVRRFAPHPLLASCLASLLPYFELRQPLPEALATLKITEALHVLQAIDPALDAVLAPVDAPGKIELVPFMEQHFTRNLPLAQFGRLTGRSLTTFNRDFRRAFGCAPQRWLTRRRLELAHYYLTSQPRRPAEVYLEVGFEDLSHFSHAFKRQFGYAPTRVGAPVLSQR